MIEFKEPGDPGHFGVAAAGGSLPPNHRWAWKTIPQAEYDDLCGQADQYAILRAMVGRAWARLSGPDYSLEQIREAAEILRDSIGPDAEPPNWGPHISE